MIRDHTGRSRKGTITRISDNPRITSTERSNFFPQLCFYPVETFSTMYFDVSQLGRKIFVIFFYPVEKCISCAGTAMPVRESKLKRRTVAGDCSGRQQHRCRPINRKQRLQVVPGWLQGAHRPNAYALVARSHPLGPIIKSMSPAFDHPHLSEATYLPTVAHEIKSSTLMALLLPFTPRREKIWSHCSSESAWLSCASLLALRWCWSNRWSCSLDSSDPSPTAL